RLTTCSPPKSYWPTAASLLPARARTTISFGRSGGAAATLASLLRSSSRRILSERCWQASCFTRPQLQRLPYGGGAPSRPERPTSPRKARFCSTFQTTSRRRRRFVERRSLASAAFTQVL